MRARRIDQQFRAVMALLALSMLVALHRPASAAPTLPRIASTFTCTDQLLLRLADPEQIVGLSPFARDRSMSWLAGEAMNYRQLSGEAEDILVLHPDIVVVGLYTRPETRQLLKDKGFRVEEFDTGNSLDDAKAQIVRMAGLLGHPERAAPEIARLDAAIARAREAVARKPYRVLFVSRRGWVAGANDMMSSLLATVGLVNAAAELGNPNGGYVPLETILMAKPDLLIVSDGGSRAEDQGKAFLLHPALEALYPPDKRIVIPERLTVCGGPMLGEALDTLVSELKRVR